MYIITTYTKNKAKKLNVIVLSSDKKNKKIDVYDVYGKFIVSIGDPNYLDYPNYTKQYGKKYADERKRLYKIRHKKDRLVKGTAGYYADQLLW
jgi:predicted double-glycine peptidase